MGEGKASLPMASRCAMAHAGMTFTMEFRLQIRVRVHLPTSPRTWLHNARCHLGHRYGGFVLKVLYGMGWTMGKPTTLLLILGTGF